MRERLGKVSEQLPRVHVDLLGEEPDVVRMSDDLVEDGTRVVEEE